MHTNIARKILFGASFIALFAAYPALAADVKADAKAETSLGTKIENGLDQTGDAISDTANKAGEAIDEKTEQAGAALKETYTDMKAYFTDENDVKAVSSLNVHKDISANFLLGADVKGPKNQEVGDIQDILVDKDGSAKRVIVNDGDIFGLGGKEASFDYSVVRGINPDKDVIVNISEAAVKTATPYDSDKIPAGLYSVKKIVGSKVVDHTGKAIAKVDDVIFDKDDADYLIVTFDTILGMGGDKVALNYDALEMANNGGKYIYKLNASQTAQFEIHKESTKSN